MKRGKREFISILTVFILAALFIFSNQAFAENKRKLRVVTCNWEPHFGENMPGGGYFSEITRQAFKRAGYASEIYFMPWKRALHVVKNGVFCSPHSRSAWISMSITWMSFFRIFPGKHMPESIAQ